MFLGGTLSETGKSSRPGSRFSRFPVLFHPPPELSFLWEIAKGLYVSRRNRVADWVARQSTTLSFRILQSTPDYSVAFGRAGKTAGRSLSSGARAVCTAPAPVGNHTGEARSVLVPAVRSRLGSSDAVSFGAPLGRALRSRTPPERFVAGPARFPGSHSQP